MKKGLFFAFAVFLCGFSLQAQEILTAGRYLDMVSERYSTIRDYEARITIHSGSTQMIGNSSYLTPNFLRIDFTTPAEQVIAFNGESLMVYLPGDRAILNQNVSPSEGGAGIATARGLTLLKKNYIPAFAVGPDPLPLEEGSAERVIRLRLARRSVSEGFREIILDINPESRLIRRITGTTITGTVVRFDFTNIRINQGIPEQRFMFDAPPAANMYNNFLFKETD